MCGNVRCMFPYPSPYPFHNPLPDMCLHNACSGQCPGVTSVLHALRDLAKDTRKSSAKTYKCQNIGTGTFLQLNTQKFISFSTYNSRNKKKNPFNFRHRSFTFNSNKSPTWYNILQFIILTFVYSSTCFKRFPAHHQELNDCSGSLWFYLRIMVTAGPTTNTARLSLRYEGKTRGCHCSHWAPDNGREKARNMLSCKQMSG
jgi:hypothetical protein